MSLKKSKLYLDDKTVCKPPLPNPSLVRPQLNASKTKFAYLMKLKMLWHANTNKYGKTQVLLNCNKFLSGFMMSSTAEVILENDVSFNYMHCVPNIEKFNNLFFIKNRE